MRPVRKRPNLQVWTGAQVSPLLLESPGSGLRATGVKLLPAAVGLPGLAHAAREVVLAAGGAIGTPQIMQLSGIGPDAVGVQFQTNDELARLAGDIGTTIFHPVGSCRMGRADDPQAVVESELRLRGVAGLRIADASLMPVVTSGNGNAPTLMIAERAAQWIADDAARGLCRWRAQRPAPTVHTLAALHQRQRRARGPPRAEETGSTATHTPT